MKNLTYKNLMAVIHRLEKKGYTLEEAEPIAQNIFKEFKAAPLGLSIEQRIERVLPKSEWESIYPEAR